MAWDAVEVMSTSLDLVTIGRCSVDLYGQQIGGRLEDMASFAKSVGGSPANMAIGVARLGLKPGFISRVGDEAMGRFIREQMQREGVDTRGLKTDPERLTALVLLGVRDESTFPLIFYRENCADAALDVSDIDEAYVASARAIVVTGTHFARANTGAAQRKAIEIAKRHGRKVAFDIDYRPNLWGLAGHGAGEERYIASDSVSARLQGVLASCDLVVGTEEEIKIAGGETDIHAALRQIRALTPGLIVLKRGPMGCVVYTGAIPDDLENGIAGEGFPVEVYNVLGAGDAFMAGFLSGWLRDKPLADCARRANACGAIAVSRLLCSPEYATTGELELFLAKGSTTRALRLDPALTHVHRATTRRPVKTPLILLDIAGALDDASQPKRLAGLLLDAALEVAPDAPCGIGVILDPRAGPGALHRATGTALTVFRSSASDAITGMTEWPVTQTVLLDGTRPELHGALIAQGKAAHHLGHELAVRIDRLASAQDIYGAGLSPDWWISDATDGLSFLISRYDPHCRGVLAATPAAAGAIIEFQEFAPLVRRWITRGLDDRGLAGEVATLLRRTATAASSICPS